MSFRLVSALSVVLALLSPVAAVASEDTATPTLSSFSRTSGAEMVPGDEIRVAYEATDDGSGIQTVVFTYRDRNGQHHQVRADGAAAPTGPATAVVGSTWPSGTYELLPSASSMLRATT